jgi:hypothetical protein
VLPDITANDAFRRPPWTGGYLEGIVDCSFLQLTPGTRDGVILDSAFDSFVDAMAPVEEAVAAAIDEHRRAEDEEASKAMLRRITRALKEAFAMLPAEEYGWLSVREAGNRPGGGPRKENPTEEDEEGGGDGTGGGAGPGTGTGDGGAEGDGGPLSADGPAPFDPGAEPDAHDPGIYAENPGVSGVAVEDDRRDANRESGQRAFFEFPGPLYRIDIRPATARVAVGGECRLQAVPRDKSRRIVDSDVTIEWTVEEGAGRLDTTTGEFVAYHAPEEPELAVIRADARQEQIECSARATVTVAAELGGAGRTAGTGAVGRQGLPGYTYRYAPGEFWRSRYDTDQSLIIVNSGHADFVFAARQSASKLRYVGRLFRQGDRPHQLPRRPPGRTPRAHDRARTLHGPLATVSAGGRRQELAVERANSHSPRRQCTGVDKLLKVLDHRLPGVAVFDPENLPTPGGVEFEGNADVPGDVAAVDAEGGSEEPEQCLRNGTPRKRVRRTEALPENSRHLRKGTNPFGEDEAPRCLRCLEGANVGAGDVADIDKPDGQRRDAGAEGTVSELADEGYRRGVEPAREGWADDEGGVDHDEVPLGLAR